MAIQEAVGPSVGIFPVDDLIFDVQISDLGLDARSIVSRCSEIGTLLQEASKRGSYFRGGSFWGSSLRAGLKELPLEPLVCAIQFPK